MIKMPEEATASYNSQLCYNDIVEPKIPAMELSPPGNFSNRDSGVKVYDNPTT